VTRPDASGVKATAGHVPDIDIAVVELLGVGDARAVADDLAREAGETGICVRIMSRGGDKDNVPRRRRRAVEETDARAVLMIEDTTSLAPGWAEALCSAFDDPDVAAVCGPVEVLPSLSPRFRALARLEYGRFDGSSPHGLPGNAFAVRLCDLRKTLAPDEGIVEHELEQRLVGQGRKICRATGLTAIYGRPDTHGARLSTRYGHGRLYGANRDGNVAIGILKAVLAMPVLSLRGFGAARRAGPVRQWLLETPWIVVMATAWSWGELVGQIAGEGNSRRSWG